MNRLFSYFIVALSTTILFASCGGGGGGDGGGGVNLNGYQMGGAIQGKELALADASTTVAGLSLIGSVDGTGTAARFNYPVGITTDGQNLYVADSYNHTIRKIVISTGVVSTLAGSGSRGSADGTGTAARFNYPRGITTDGQNLYVADSYNNTIRKIVISTGVVSTLAGYAGWYGSADGTGTAAKFDYPAGITTDGQNLYVTDSDNYTIRKIVISTGVVSTLTGSAGLSGSADGAGTAARFNYPQGITAVGQNLYVADSNNSTIRQIVISTGVVSTLTGLAGLFGHADGTGTAARFSYPQGITNDGQNLYVADMYNNTVRKIVISTGVVSTFAGSGSYGFTDGTGTAAKFYYPQGITTDGQNLYVADSYNHAIRMIVISTGVVSTVAGPVDSTGSADGAGTAARFSYPQGITTDGQNLYVADSDNHTIRQIVISTGVVSTLTGSAGSSGSVDGTGTAARFNYPQGITTDGQNLYVSDSDNHTIRQIVISTGVVSTLTGSVGSSGSADGTGTAARFNYPQGITTDGQNLYVADSYNNTIRKIVISTGVVSTLTGSAGSSGSADGTGTAARFTYPQGITTDGTNLYVTDNGSIRKIVLSTLTVSTIATTAYVNATGITTDGTYLYVGEMWNNTIDKISIPSGVVSTLAGSTGLRGSVDGTGAAARFYNPQGITTDGTSLYVVDSGNNTVRGIL